jgi:CheY-like chemotaxis protein
MSLREILVVDDSDADLLYTRLLLEAAAVAQVVSTFETGMSALEYMQRPAGHHVDVILLDINMPEMSGFEFLEAYQQLPPLQQAQAVVVMLTNSPDPADRARAFSYPCVKHYVVKPLDIQSARHLATFLADPGCA